MKLLIENLETNEGFKLNGDIKDIAYYLATWRFANDYVHMSFIEEAIENCATELGCIYRDVYELESDIRKYYI